MDIRDWLENTEHQAPPDEQDELGMPAFLQARSVVEHPIRKRRRKRKRESSDRSIIRPQLAKHEHRQAAICAVSPVRVAHAARPHSLQCSRSRSISRQSLHDVAHKKYEKRARYKTRPDHYDVKPSKRRRERDTRLERESRRQRHQSHRSGDGHRTAGLVQSFQFKNGPQRHRLTLKPEVSKGLFKHGRASTQAAGCGVGLPDLAFNEMRFLQKPMEHQDADPVEPPMQPTKRNQKRSINEEISNYFAEIDPDAPTSLGQRHAIKGIRGRTALSPSDPGNPRQPDPPVDLPEKPFLGFGSKGAQAGSKSRVPTPNSYLTWSPSIHVPPKSPVISQVVERQETSGRTPAGRRSETKPVNTYVYTSTGASKGGQDVSDDKIPRGKCIHPRRLKGPARAELYRPVRATIRQGKPSESPLRTTSQPLPEHPPPLTRNVSAHATSDIPDGSFYTTDILIVREMRPQYEGARSGSKSMSHTWSHDQPIDHLCDLDKENFEPDESTPTRRLLNQAQEAVANAAKRHSNLALNLQKRRAETAFGENHRQNERNMSHKVDLPDQWPDPAGVVPRSRMSTVSARRAEYRNHRQPCSSDKSPDEDEMLDNQPDVVPLNLKTDYMYATHRQVEDLVYGRQPHHTTAHGQAQLGWQQLDEALAGPPSNFEPLSDAIRPHISATSVSAEISIRGLSLDREFQNARVGGLSVGPESTTADELAGFWKPHRLY